MLASSELETHNITVVSQLPGRPVIAKVDADLLKQALLNVVLNGAQAMPAGGSVRREVSVRLAAGLSEGRHVLALRAAEGDVVDEGDGFLALDVER